MWFYQITLRQLNCIHLVNLIIGWLYQSGCSHNSKLNATNINSHSHHTCYARSGAGEACITLAPRLAEDSSAHSFTARWNTAVQTAAGSGRRPSHSRLIGQGQSHGHTSLSKRVKKSHPTMCLGGGENWEIFLNDIIFNHSGPPYFHATYPKPLCVNTLFSRHPSKLEIAVGGSNGSKLKSDDLSLQQRQPNRDARPMHESWCWARSSKQSSPSRLYGSKMYRDANQGTVLIQAKDKASKPKVQIWGYFELSR